MIAILRCLNRDRSTCLNSASSYLTSYGSFGVSSLLVVGCGYLGRRVVSLALQDGWRVFGTTRQSPERIEALGARPIRLDWDDARTLASLPSVDAVVVAVAYDRRSRVDRDASQVGGLRRLIQSLDRGDRRARICYVSTTGVYHQTGGVWVDETSPTFPARAGGRAHLRAESVLRQCRGNQTYSILRLAGIYGPGRVPRAADVRAGREIASPSNGYLNLIHVDDAARGVMASLQVARPSRLYVVADDAPVIRKHFYEEIARQVSAPSPRFVTPDSDSGVAWRSTTNKRVWNRRFKQELIPRLTFPSYVEGLTDVLSSRPTDEGRSDRLDKT